MSRPASVQTPSRSRVAVNTKRTLTYGLSAEAARKAAQQEVQQAHQDVAEANNAVRTAVDGETIVVSGLSASTEDLLYLTLRVAAIEDYVSRAVPLPVVADDLFLNFDEERCLRILGELAERIQLLFFNHHEHLVASPAMCSEPTFR